MDFRLLKSIDRIYHKARSHIRLALLSLLTIGLIVGLLGGYSAKSQSAIWQPTPGTTFQWQLSGPIDLSVVANVYDLDLFETDVATIQKLHQQGRKVIGYVSVGAWENWRSDQDQFPKSVIGKDYMGWPGEKWLDIRNIDALAPILRARLDLLKSKGFDAIEPDNIDGYEADTGFPLTQADQIRFDRWLSTEAHSRGLSIGLKNSPELIPILQPDFDWALTEDAFQYKWSSAMGDFIKAGKAVFMTEYTDTKTSLQAFCPTARSLNYTGILKHRDLTAWRAVCPLSTHQT